MITWQHFYELDIDTNLGIGTLTAAAARGNRCETIRKQTNK